MRIRSILGSFVVLAFAAACGGESQPPAATPSSATSPAATTPAPTPAPAAAAPEAPKKTLGQKIDETSRSLVDGWNAHDADKVAAAYTEEATMRLVGGPDMNGRSAIKAAAADTFKAYPDFKVSVTRVIGKENTQFVEWIITGTNNGDSDLFKTKATKRPMGVHGVDVVTFTESGLIKDDRRYFDMPTQMNQLDAKAKAGSFRAIATAPGGNPAIAMSKGAPDEAKNLDAVKGMYKAMDSHKSDAVMALASPDGSMDDFAQPQPMKGAKALKGFLDTIFKAVPDSTQELGAQVAADDLVASEVTMKGTWKGPMGPMKATNKPITMHFVDIIQVKDGKMVNGWSYSNSAEMMPPPAPAPVKADAKADAKPDAKAAAPAAKPDAKSDKK